MRDWLTSLAVAMAILLGVLSPPAKRPKPAGSTFPRAAMRVQWAETNPNPNDPCGAVISRTPFTVLDYHASHGGLGIWWDQNQLILEMPKVCLLVLSSTMAAQPVQLPNGPWWLVGGDAVNVMGHPGCYPALNDKVQLRLHETMFPIGLVICFQALTPNGTSDAWRLLVQ